MTTYATSEHAEQAKAEQEAEQAATTASRAERAAALEDALRRAFLATPGATPEQWVAEKAGILAEDRKQAALRREDQARRSQGSLYRSF